MASTSGPLSNQRCAARSMLAAATASGTWRSSNVRCSPTVSATSARSFAGSNTWVRERARCATCRYQGSE